MIMTCSLCKSANRCVPGTDRTPAAVTVVSGWAVCEACRIWVMGGPSMPLPGWVVDRIYAMGRGES